MMNVDEALKKTAVLGAAGKMGKGIALLLLQEMALLNASLVNASLVNASLVNSSLEQKNAVSLVLVDANRAALPPLMDYLRTHLKVFAEKQLNRLRRLFIDKMELASNEQVIQFFIESSMRFVYPATQIEEAHDASLIFEAIVEDSDLKTTVFRRLKQVSTTPFYVFSNTSSLPIHVLNTAAQLDQRIIGFHFYNPPPVQKLLELIPLQQGNTTLYKLAIQLGQRLNKQMIVSKDVAGFIGNGFLIREFLFACEKYQVLCLSYPAYQAIYLLNLVTHTFLLRPMGIFQLADFVGIDVVEHICQVMQRYLPENFSANLLATMKSLKILGGQTAEGKQKNGFFEYRQNQITAVYSPLDQQYFSLEDEWCKSANEALGALPASHQSWKKLHKEKNRAAVFPAYFKELDSMNGLGATMSREFLQKDLAIARQLVDEGVAANMQDVETVLKEGFYHLYGPQEILTENDKHA